MNQLPLLYTPGDPSGIGFDLVLISASQGAPCPLAVVACPHQLKKRAQVLKLDVVITEIDDPQSIQMLPPKHIGVIACFGAEHTHIGEPNTRTVAYVLNTLERAWQLMQEKRASAWITGPVHKGIINDAGVPFDGHTQWLKNKAGVDDVVMMLASHKLRVALVTDHIPLSQVPSQITPERLTQKLEILNHSLTHDFGLAEPIIRVTGLNPHAG